MKIAFIFLTIFLLVFAFFYIKEERQEYYPSKGEEFIGSLLTSAAKNIRDKYNLKPCGVGVAMPGGPIQEITLCFATKYPYTKEQLREMLIKLSFELIDKINSNKEIYDFIKRPPFTIKNVQIIIYNHDVNGRQLNDPDISDAQISQGILSYSSVDPEDSFKYKNEYEESYEEALRALATH